MTDTDTFAEPPHDPWDDPEAHPGQPDLAQLQQQVDELTTRLGKQFEAIVALDQVVTTIVDTRTGQLKQAPWLYHDVSDVIWQDQAGALPAWVEWWNTSYAPDRNGRIPDCWALHGGLAAEIATLYWTWRKAFLDAKATADAAQNWHDRWLPGFQSRIERWASTECKRGTHRD